MDDQGSDGSGVAQPVTVAIRNLEGELLRLRQGEITDDEFRPSRTILGVYGQRQPEQYMVRVRIPYGGLASDQLRCLAQVAREYGNGTAHVTTRQNVQLHWLKLDRIPEVLRQLAEVGLTTLQSGGNSVRTVAACPLAGVCSREVFDMTYAAAELDRRFLGDEAVMHLPRKFKTGLSGCGLDCAYSRIQDFGAVAVVQEEDAGPRRGFRIVVGGGLGAFPRQAQLLEEFIDEEELLPTFEAVIRLFDQLGDRKNKQKARLKFVLQRLGIEEFRRLVHEEKQTLGTEDSGSVTQLPPDAVTPPPAPLPTRPVGSDPAGYLRWRCWNVRSQRQPQHNVVFIPLPLGDATSEQMEVVAGLAHRFADRKLRTSQQQDLVLHNVPDGALENVYEGLAAAGLTGARASGIADVTTCPGTSACSLAITASKGLATQLANMLQDERYQEDESLADFRIKVSGCPDSCGQHQLADIGLQGCALHASDRLYPAFQILVGGEVTEEGTRFAQPVLKLPARKVPEAVARLLAFYRSQRKEGERFSQFVDRKGVGAIKQLLEEYTRVPPPAEDIWNYVDWDSTRMYVLERGEGECAV